MKAYLQSLGLEDWVKLLLTGFLLGWNTLEGAVFENEYPKVFVKLYPLAIWRWLLLVALLTGAMWCGSLGLMLAYAAFFYVMDMEVTMDKWV